MKEQYITITGIKHYYGIIPFEIGRKITCVKEPDNYYDQEAIRCQVKHIGTVGYVANSTYTVAVGTKSAGRIAHKVKKKFKVQPFRVLIDQKVLQMKLIDFEHSEKMQLVDILNQEVLIDGKNQYVNNAIKIYCKSVFDALNDDDSSLMRFYRIEL